ncbi:hypothetical protein [Luteibacter sp. Lutesp34]|uniref:hypothetical protein n=1 Tax=Luteibacter sp. Lutesp34 TaxID=3243030 RepID=UPI0039B4C32C
MSRFKRVIGWVSWLVVATHIYGIAWLAVDDTTYFFLPTVVYDWLDSLFGATSLESTYSVATWSTAVVGTVILHVIAWLVVPWLKPASGSRKEFWAPWRRRIFPVAGWTSWLLISPLAILLIAEALRRARGGERPTSDGFVEYVGCAVLVGLLHLAARYFVHSRRK